MADLITYRDAVAEGLAREMRRDPSVVCLGEDIGAAGGVFKTTVGLFAEFGPQRVRDTPISEQAIVGMAMGAAMTGMRPVAEIMFSDFLACCWDFTSWPSRSWKMRYMTGGQVTVPLVVRTANGGGLGFGAQHSQSVENWALTVPGLKIAAPSNPADVIGLLASAVRSDDPVVFFEHKGLFASRGEPAPDGHVVPLGEAAIARPGTDVTVVALAATVPIALSAAAELAASGVEPEVIDLRCLVPLDMATVLASVRKTSRLLIVEENPYQGGWGGTVASIVADEGFELLDAPVRRVAAAHGAPGDRSPTHRAWKEFDCLEGHRGATRTRRLLTPGARTALPGSLLVSTGLSTVNPAKLVSASRRLAAGEDAGAGRDPEGAVGLDDVADLGGHLGQRGVEVQLPAETAHDRVAHAVQVAGHRGRIGDRQRHLMLVQGDVRERGPEQVEARLDGEAQAGKRTDRAAQLSGDDHVEHVVQLSHAVLAIRGREQRPARMHDPPQLADRGGDIGHVVEHVHREPHVGAVSGQRQSLRVAVDQRDPPWLAAVRDGGEHAGGQIQADDLAAPAARQQLPEVGTRCRSPTGRLPAGCRPSAPGFSRQVMDPLLPAVAYAQMAILARRFRSSA